MNSFAWYLANIGTEHTSTALCAHNFAQSIQCRLKWPHFPQSNCFSFRNPNIFLYNKQTILRFLFSVLLLPLIGRWVLCGWQWKSSQSQASFLAGYPAGFSSHQHPIKPGRRTWEEKERVDFQQDGIGIWRQPDWAPRANAPRSWDSWEKVPYLVV